MKTYKFTELSSKAQKRALQEYLDGWEMTHDQDDLSKEEALEVLTDNTNDEYDVHGNFLGEE